MTEPVVLDLSAVVAGRAYHAALTAQIRAGDQDAAFTAAEVFNHWSAEVGRLVHKAALDSDVSLDNKREAADALYQVVSMLGGLDELLTAANEAVNGDV